MSPDKLLPPELAGWKPNKTVPLHSPGEMYSYMDGGAELYLSYKVVDALSRTYSNGKSEVVAEIYDMAEARNAFGVFTQIREDETAQFGQGSYSIPGALLFWKGRFYISLSAWEPAEESDLFIKELARFIEGKITEIGDVPGIVKMLPEAGMIPYGFRYFHHPVWINSFFFITDENLFAIDDTTNSVIARYIDNGDERKFLLLIEYTDSEKAQKVFNEFAGKFFPNELPGNGRQSDNGKWTAAKLIGKILTAVFNASSRQGALDLINQVQKLQI